VGLESSISLNKIETNMGLVNTIISFHWVFKNMAHSYDRKQVAFVRESQEGV